MSANLNLIVRCNACKIFIFRPPSPLPIKSRRFTYGELITMTDKFSTIIGKGGSGIVYLGVNQRNGSQVAVKLLSLSSSQDQKEFEMEACMHEFSKLFVKKIYIYIPKWKAS